MVLMPSFCSFRSICGFDERLPGYGKRRIEEQAPEEILRKMREAVEEDKKD